ncbi:MAG: hypothetical protein ABIJ25_01655 [Pseudomonadota bacterium]|nr:hypothetical protein [Patescibacteria group bacterium]
MEFILKKVSDHGTSNPIVARLSVQTSELIKFYPLSEKQRDEILKIYFEKVQPRLLRCYELKETLLSELCKIGDDFDKEGIRTQSSSRVATVPQVMNLSETCENYLYNAKSCLRDLAGIFESLFGQVFTEARYDRIYEWSKGKFGDKDSLTAIIKQDHDLWIKKIVAMRNAVEHPGGYAGYLHIHNIEVGTDPKTKNPLLVPPAWHLNDEPRAAVLTDFETFITNLLEFAEDLFILSLEKFNKKFPIVVVQIPEAERDPKCPVRLRMTLTDEFVKKSKT